LKKVIEILRNNDAIPTHISRKFEKTAEVFCTQITILKAKQLNLLVHIKKIKKVTFKKYKIVSGIDLKMIKKGYRYYRNNTTKKGY